VHHFSAITKDLTVALPISLFEKKNQDNYKFMAVMRPNWIMCAGLAGCEILLTGSDLGLAEKPILIGCPLPLIESYASHGEPN
jgi:hypothetical protein